MGNLTHLTIEYPRYKSILSDIRACVEMSQSSDEPQCMSLEGPPGAGKSTLTKNYANSHPRFRAGDGEKIPVLYIETPSPVTVKGMAAHILQVLGDPLAHKGTQWNMNSRVINFLVQCEVQLVILDDFHHLIDQQTKRVLAKVSDWLKVLIKETNIPFLVVGIEGEVERILLSNSQLSRLFAVREVVTPIAVDLANPSSIEEFATFLNSVEAAVAMRASSELDRLDIVLRVHYATRGVVGNIMNLFRFSTMIAQSREWDAETQGAIEKGYIPLRVFDEAYEKRLAKHIRRPNPFIHRDFPFPVDQEDSVASAVNESLLSAFSG